MGMKYMCECGEETRLKSVLLGQKYCKRCGKKHNQEEVIADMERQKSEKKQK